MDKESSSKEIYLGLATVRIIGQQRPRSTQHSLNQLVNNDINVIRRESFEQSDKTLLPVNLPVDFASNKNEERSKKFEGIYFYFYLFIVLFRRNFGLLFILIVKVLVSIHWHIIDNYFISLSLSSMLFCYIL